MFSFFCPCKAHNHHKTTLYAEKKAGKVAIFTPDALSGYLILKLSLHVIVPSVLKPTALILGILINRLSKIVINLVIGYQLPNAVLSLNNIHRAIIRDMSMPIIRGVFI